MHKNNRACHKTPSIALGRRFKPDKTGPMVGSTATRFTTPLGRGEVAVSKEVAGLRKEKKKVREGIRVLPEAQLVRLGRERRRDEQS